MCQLPHAAVGAEVHLEGRRGVGWTRVDWSENVDPPDQHTLGPPVERVEYGYQLFSSVVYFSRGTLRPKKVKGHYWGDLVEAFEGTPKGPRRDP